MKEVKITQITMLQCVMNYNVASACSTVMHLHNICISCITKIAILQNLLLFLLLFFFFCQTLT